MWAFGRHYLNLNIFMGNHWNKKFCSRFNIWNCATFSINFKWFYFYISLEIRLTLHCLMLSSSLLLFELISYNERARVVTLSNTMNIKRSVTHTHTLIHFYVGVFLTISMYRFISLYRRVKNHLLFKKVM